MVHRPKCPPALACEYVQFAFDEQRSRLVMPAQYLHKLVHSQRRYVVFLSELCKHNPNIMRMDVLHVLI